MAIFKNNKKQQTPQNSQEALERAQKSGTDKRVYGDLLYKCRRCGYEGKINNVPNADKIAWALMNGNRSQIFRTANFYIDVDTHTEYTECMHHECAPVNLLGSTAIYTNFCNLSIICPFREI